MNTKGTKPAWYGLAAVTLGTGIFFLATNKGRLFKKGVTSLKNLLGSAEATPVAAEPVQAPGGSSTAGRTPTPENGHVRDVNASNPPKPDSGTNFTPQGDVHEPKK
ncbi:hypothetical protein [Hymenobacter sp. BT559]|uniref:hypothetical protein n=1 Tax=Hymenobacter sp. BT559 TaxID=2795729 RepID=UPI0018EBA0E3|nr:hypothetical protein [Hymenobacter sp. BT559]MBJ6141986.1 hypothetical protein [Hymenobacter sp. BT559]